MIVVIIPINLQKLNHIISSKNIMSKKKLKKKRTKKNIIKKEEIIMVIYISKTLMKLIISFPLIVQTLISKE